MKTSSSWTAFCLIIVAIIGVTVGIIQVFDISPSSAVRSIDPGLVEVVRVHDGDTISVRLAGKTERVRLLAIDTPEVNHPDIGAECYGIEAGNHLRELLGNSEVRLEADPRADNRDYYDRLLRYIYLPDGTNVNQQMVSDGYAMAYTGFSNTQTPRMLELEEQARTDSIGLWQSCEVTSDGRTWTTQQLSP